MLASLRDPNSQTSVTNDDALGTIVLPIVPPFAELQNDGDWLQRAEDAFLVWTAPSICILKALARCISVGDDDHECDRGVITCKLVRRSLAEPSGIEMATLTAEPKTLLVGNFKRGLVKDRNQANLEAVLNTKCRINSVNEIRGGGRKLRDPLSSKLVLYISCSSTFCVSALAGRSLKV